MRIFQFNDYSNSDQASESKARPVARAGQGEGEAELEAWLNSSPEALLDERVLLFSRQPGLSTGVPDLLGIDRFGNVLIFELKIGDSGSESASEASIVSQPQLYAQAIDQHTYTELNDLYLEYKDGDWEVPEVVQENNTLIDAFNSHFDQQLKSWELNASQRLVIVAESITAQTRQSTRWLRDRGLDVQCVEVQRFEFPSGEIGFGAVTVVDYDETRAETDSGNKPGDRVFTNNVFSSAFPEISDDLSVKSIQPVLGNLSTNYPYLETQAEDHPDTVRYGLRVNPYEDQEVKVAIDSSGEEKHAELLREYSNEFEAQGFKVSSSRKSMRIVVDTWSIDGVEDLRDEEFVDRVSKRYIELVNLGHEAFSQ